MKKHSRRDFLRWVGYGAFAGLAPIGYGELTTGWLQIVRREVRLPRWDADGFRLALLADFHAQDPERALLARKAVRLAMGERPNAIAIPGDFISHSAPKHVALVQDVLAELADAPCPVVSVLGNHDYWTRRTGVVLDMLRRSPIGLLRNETREVDGVVFAGVDDPMLGHARYDFLRERDHGRSVVTLLHEPDYVDEVPEGSSIVVSGHSHGGQICLPGGVPVHLPKGARRYWGGFYPDAATPLYVTRGIGTTGPHWRLFCRPEITIMTIRSA